MDAADARRCGHEHDLRGEDDGLAGAGGLPRLPVPGVGEVIAPLPHLVIIIIIIIIIIKIQNKNRHVYPDNTIPVQCSLRPRKPHLHTQNLWQNIHSCTLSSAATETAEKLSSDILNNILLVRWRCAHYRLYV